LTDEEIKRVKKIAIELLRKLKLSKLKTDHWRDKESSRDAVHTAILDFLYGDETGLPVEKYTYEDVKAKTDIVYDHVYQVYPTLPSPYFGQRSAEKF
jgi:type I restriction enzyme R subunit